MFLSVFVLISRIFLFRFSVPNFEHMDVYHRLHHQHDPGNIHTHPYIHGQSEVNINPSVMEWVDIIGAGILHNDKSPAVMSFHDTPSLRGVTVRNSASDGVSIVSATKGFEMLYNK